MSSEIQGAPGRGPGMGRTWVGALGRARTPASATHSAAPKALLAGGLGYHLQCQSGIEGCAGLGTQWSLRSAPALCPREVPGRRRAAATHVCEADGGQRPLLPAVGPWTLQPEVLPWPSSCPREAVWPWDQASLGSGSPSSSWGSLPRAAAHTPLTGQTLAAPCSVPGRRSPPAKPRGLLQAAFHGKRPRGDRALGSAPTPVGRGLSPSCKSMN